jgi:hypothetical protein
MLKLKYILILIACSLIGGFIGAWLGYHDGFLDGRKKGNEDVVAATNGHDAKVYFDAFARFVHESVKKDYRVTLGGYTYAVPFFFKEKAANK